MKGQYSYTEILFWNKQKFLYNRGLKLLLEELKQKHIE